MQLWPRARGAGGTSPKRQHFDTVFRDVPNRNTGSGPQRLWLGVAEQARKSQRAVCGELPDGHMADYPYLGWGLPAPFSVELLSKDPCLHVISA